jgi:hypothetical protein
MRTHLRRAGFYEYEIAIALSGKDDCTATVTRLVRRAPGVLPAEIRGLHKFDISGGTEDEVLRRMEDRVNMWALNPWIADA